jgi:carnitine 3-dehydrogenase
MTIREMERIRDDNLIAIIHGLKANDWGAGKALSNYEQRLIGQSQSAANDD